LYRRTEIQRRGSVLLKHKETSISNFFPSPTSDHDRGPSTAERMACYERFAKELSTSSCRQTLDNSGINPESITHLITVSCTGFAAPGFDINLVKELGLPPTVYRTHIGFMGCHGTMNALRVAQGFIANDQKAHVLLCATEVCSIHFQYGREPGDVVANSLFADGAASLIMKQSVSRTPAQSAATYTDSFSYIVPNSETAMTWRIENNGFSMTLSAEVPLLIEEHLQRLLKDWLGKHNLTVDQIGSWAVHPGGPRILSAVEHSLGLPSDALVASRDILAEYGNMSSPTVLFIIQRLLAKQKSRFPCVVLAFGPGLTIEAALLEREDNLSSDFEIVSS
jgi:predicted naringenin-chalcone synthase